MTDIADIATVASEKTFCQVIDDILVDGPNTTVVLKVEETSFLYTVSISGAQKEEGRAPREALERTAGQTIIEGSDDLAKIAMDSYRSIIFITHEDKCWGHAIAYSVNGKQDVISHCGQNTEEVLRRIVRSKEYAKPLPH